MVTKCNQPHTLIGPHPHTAQPPQTNHSPFASQGPGLSMLTSTKQFEQFSIKSQDISRDTVQIIPNLLLANLKNPSHNRNKHGHSTGMPGSLRLPAKELEEAPPSAPSRVVAPRQSLTGGLMTHEYVRALAVCTRMRKTHT